MSHIEQEVYIDLLADALEALKHALQALSDATASGQIDSAQWQDVRRECHAVLAKARGQ